MTKRILKFAVVPVALVTATVLVGMLAQPVWAQVRAALVRDADNPALAPFTANVGFNFTALNTQALVTTVPAGKRLVIQHVSYSSGGVSSSQVVYAALRNAQFGTIVTVLPINAPHASVTSGLTLQEASTPITAYFDAGQDVWVSASYTGGSRDITIYLTGYYITP